MGPDYEKYRSFLSEFDLADGQKDALIKELWTILATFVDRSFEEDPVQHVIGKDEEDSGPADSDEVQLKPVFEKKETDENEPEP